MFFLSFLNSFQTLADENFWNSSQCSSDSMHNGRDCSPNHFHIPTNQLSNPVNQQKFPYSNQTTNVYSNPPQNEHSEEQYEEIFYSSSTNPVPFVRVVKRRTTANKKERRRTQSINSAFAYLRDCIPNVPSDTKLSKVNQNQKCPFGQISNFKGCEYRISNIEYQPNQRIITEIK